MGREKCKPITLCTANGDTKVDERCKGVNVPSLDLSVKPLILENAPAVLSLGRLVLDDGFRHYWSRETGCLLYKDDVFIRLEVSNYVPFIPSKFKKYTYPSFQGGSSSSGSGDIPKTAHDGPAASDRWPTSLDSIMADGKAADTAKA